MTPLALVKRIAGVSSARVLVVSSVVALIALVLIVWSMLDPRPIPVILAMSVAQVLGTISFAAFLLVVVRDLRRANASEARETSETEKKPVISSS